MDEGESIATVIQNYLVGTCPPEVIPDDLHEQISNSVREFAGIEDVGEVEQPTTIQEFMAVASRAGLLIWFDASSGKVKCEAGNGQ